MRLYTFGNYYLSSLQQGLQGTHVLSEMMYLFDQKPTQRAMLLQWAKQHKTIVMLNGGNSASIQAIFERFEGFRRRGMKLPFAKFHEDAPSLGGALTACGILVPEPIYTLARTLRDEPTPDLMDHPSPPRPSWERLLAQELNHYPLAT